MKKPKKYVRRFYVIQGPTGIVYYRTLQNEKFLSWNDFKFSLSNKDHDAVAGKKNIDAFLRKQGYRCIRVELREV